MSLFSPGRKNSGSGLQRTPEPPRQAQTPSYDHAFRDTQPDKPVDIPPPFQVPAVFIQGGSGTSEGEAVSKLRERVAVLETRTDAVCGTVSGQGKSIEGVADFHKGVKIGAWLVGGLLLVIPGFLSWLFWNDIQSTRKMLNDYEFCEQHKAEKDKSPDCIVAPKVSPASSTSNATD